MERKCTSRRELLQLGVVAATAMACQGCRLFGSRKPDSVVKQEDGRIRLPPEDSAKLQAEGGVLVKPEGAADKILVIRDRNGGLHALNATCTHMGCDVVYDKDLGNIRCPCHGSQFGLDGSNIKGPATRPLKAYTVQAQDSQIVVTGLSPIRQ
jgi:Rieske Fe-S protein